MNLKEKTLPFLKRLNTIYYSQLKLQLLSGTGQILFVMILVSSVAVGYIVSRLEGGAWRSRQWEAAANAANRVSVFLERQESALRLVDMLVTDEVQNSPAILDKVLADNPALQELVFLDAVGKVLAHTPQDQPVLAHLFTIPQSVWFAEASLGKRYYSSLQVSPQGQPYLVLALPSSGGGVVAARLDMHLLWEVVADVRFGQSGHMYVVDRQGQVIAHPDSDQVLSRASIAELPELSDLLLSSGQVFYNETSGLEGSHVIGAMAPVPITDWRVISEMTIWEYYTSSRNTWLLLICGDLLMFWLVNRLITRLLERLVLQPMTRLQDGARQVGQGNLAHRINLGRQDELGLVAQAFDRMASDLDARQQQIATQTETLRELNEQLEARVEERTAQLSQVNADLRREATEREDAEAALRASEAKFRELFENVMDGVFQSSIEGRILIANPALVRILGYASLEELQGVDIAQDLYVDPGVRQERNESLLASGFQRNVELQLKRKDGQPITVLENVHTVCGEGGEVLYFEGTLTDITERKEAEALLKERGEALQRKTHQQERLIDTARQLAASLDVHEVLHSIAAGAQEILDAFGCVIYLLEEDGNTLNPVVAIDPLFEEEILQSKITVDSSLNGRGIRSRRGMIFNNPLGTSNSFQIPGTTVDETERVVVAPLIADDQVLGSLCVNRLNADFTGEDLALAETFAAYAATALKNAQTHDRLQREVEERTRAEDALRESQERYTLAIQGANDGLWDWDLRTDQVYFSPRWKSMLGYADEQVGDSPEEWLSRVHSDDLDTVKVNLGKHLQGLTPHFESEHRMQHRDGGYRWVLARGLVVRSVTASSNGPDLIATRMAGSLTDITARKLAEEQLLHDAFHDALTGLPNRALFLDRLGRSIERANRHPENSYAVLFLDLDRFKVVNDSLGHNTGDQLLIGIAQRLSFCLRSADTAARLGGDEFVVLLEDISELQDALVVAERVRDDLKLPFILGGHEVVVSTSIGIVFGTGAPGTTAYERAEDALRDADIALYRAKALGKDRFVLFDPNLRTRAIARLDMENELRAALERGEFFLHYQPIRSLVEDRITGFEALLRWNSPARGTVPPGEIIPVAEETGLIVPIGEWVLREACRQLSEWQTQFPTDPPLTINVNISGVQFAHSALYDQVKAVLDETHLAPRSLQLEITESVFMENAGHANEVLLRLRDLGVRLQIDDFGTGYSSLAYLQNFPIQTIKIDRSFIKRISANGEANGGSEIVKTIVALARDLGMEAVAEGVETQEQLDKLKALDCHYGQGFLFARPMDGEAAQRLLASLYPRIEM